VSAPPESPASVDPAAASLFPKIELHVHFEATVRPARLLEIAARNRFTLPAKSEQGLADYIRGFGTFRQFIGRWIALTPALQTPDDFRQVVVDYAGEAKSHGCVYIEGIFSPAEPVARGAAWQDVFDGYCAGAAEARERHGVEVRLDPEITRGFPKKLCQGVTDTAIAYRDRGVVALGLGGAEDDPRKYAAWFAAAREAGLGAVPHAGEQDGPESVVACLDALRADRIRHGIRAVEDDALVRRLADERVVCDVTPTSNLRTGVVPSLAIHPLPTLYEAGVLCSISTDDPVLFDTDLGREYEIAMRMGLDPEAIYAAGVHGALCDAATKARLRAIGEDCDWEAARRAAGVIRRS
jgi:aminodeoxyfutalosine deaminase